LLEVVQKPKGFEVSQTRFFSSEISQKTSKDSTAWHIPIAIKNIKTGKSSKFLLKAKNFHTTEYGSNFPIKLNSGEAGFYRVNYVAQILERLHPLIKNKKLPAIDRLGIIRDAFALAEAQKIPTPQALDLVLSYLNENDYTVWTEISAGLNLVHQLIFNQAFEGRFKEFAKTVFEKEAKRLGWATHKNESHTQGLLRSLVLANYGGFGGSDAIKKAQELFKKGKVSADLRGVVYQLVAENGGEAEFKKFQNMYIKETLNEEKNRIGRALVNFQNEKLVKKALDFALSKNVRLQDAPLMLAGAVANPKGRKTAWAFIKNNWKELNKRYPASGHMLGRALKPLGLMSEKKDVEDLRKFFTNHKTEGMQRTVQQILERADNNCLWLINEKNKIQNWLDNEK
jgi:aminopeptidase N